jgi:ABC-type lipoprotein export system ATPase subunit
MTTAQFVKNTKRVGSFWALYLTGFHSFLDIKATILVLALQMVCSLVVVHQTNRLLLSDDDTQAYGLAATVVIVCLEQPINAAINMWLSPRSNSERLQISERIVNWVVYVFDRSTYEWRRENPNIVQIEAMDQIFNTFFGITWNIADIVTSSINVMSFVVMAFFNSWFVGMVIVLGSVAISLFRRHFNADLERVNSEMSDRSKAVRLATSIQHTGRFDLAVNPAMRQLMTPDQYNPVNGFANSIRIWDQRDNLSHFSKLIDRTTKAVVLLSVCFFIIHDKKMVVWILLNGHKLFGFTNIISRIDDIRNLMGGRIAPHLELIKALRLEEGHQIEIMIDDTHSFIPGDPCMRVSASLSTPCLIRTEQLKTIEIGRLEWKSGNLHLKLLTPLIVNFLVPGIIILDGKKGCGKSLTLDIFAGLYDGYVTSGSMLVNGIHVRDEFKNPIFWNTRFCIQQLVSDQYRRNPKGTIIMTLRELFPGATYDMIQSWLIPFDMKHKMPAYSFNVLDIFVGKNERSFSPGEIQAMVIASQLWKVRQLNIPFLLLDEPERNIDYQTVKNIFEMVIRPMIAEHNMTVIMVTHNDELKAMLKRVGLVKDTLCFNTVGSVMTFGA